MTIGLPKALVGLVLLALGVSAKRFGQLVCQDGSCSDGCVQTNLEQFECYELLSGGSAFAGCSGGTLVQNIFSFSPNCSGYQYQQNYVSGQCYPASGVGYVEYLCNIGFTPAFEAAPMGKRIVGVKNTTDGQPSIKAATTLRAPPQVVGNRRP